MDFFYNIIFLVGALALIGIIVSVLGMVGMVPLGRAVGPEDYDNHFFQWFLASIAVLVLDVVMAVLVLVWDYDPSHVAAPALGVLCLAVLIKWAHKVYGLPLSSTLASCWSKLLPKSAAAAAPVKKPWMSKTILVNTLVALLLLAEDKLSFLQGVLPASKYQIAAFALPVVNMLLRVYTTQGLSLKAFQPRCEASQ